LLDRAGFPQAVSHLLSQPDWDIDSPGDVRGGEWLFELWWQQVLQVSGVPQVQPRTDGLQHTVLDTVSLASRAACQGRQPVFLLLGHQDFQGQSRVREHADEVHQVEEQVIDRRTVGTVPPRFDPTATPSAFDQQFTGCQWFDDEYTVVLIQQPTDFVANRTQRTMLDFHQPIALHGIDTKVAQPHFTGLGVLGVQ